MIKKALQTKYHIHITFGYIIGWYLATTYTGLSSVEKSIIHLLALTVICTFWEGLGKLIDKGNKFDIADIASGVFGGFLALTFPDYKALAIVLTVVFLIIHLILFKWNKK